jgi:hypothetical protein
LHDCFLYKKAEMQRLMTLYQRPVAIAVPCSVNRLRFNGLGRYREKRPTPDDFFAENMSPEGDGAAGLIAKPLNFQEQLSSLVGDA